MDPLTVATMKMTEKRLLDLVRSGYGQGHGRNYRAFLKNTRSAISKRGTQSSGKTLYAFDRACDFKSRQEKKIARALLWLGASDVREQFPIWPMIHPHPLRGAPGSELMDLPDAPGLASIARQAGIRLGVFIGTDTPYVATIDYMVTVYRTKIPNLVAVACKDRDVVMSDAPLSRPLERLELERLYCEQICVPHVIVDREVFGAQLLANLEWLMPDETTVCELSKDPSLDEFLTSIAKALILLPIDIAVEHVSTQFGWPATRGFTAFRYATWTQFLDIDLTQPILMTQMATGGGNQIRELLRQEIFGEIDHE